MNDDKESRALGLSDRLIEHALIHDEASSPFDEDQAQWASDLRIAAGVIDVLADRERMLGDLLAVIHGDGGHYQYKHGAAKAVEDAVKKLSYMGWRQRSVLGAMNAAERLCRLLYGRGAEIGDTIGGLDAQMLHDAYAEIDRLRKAVLSEDYR